MVVAFHHQQSHVTSMRRRRCISTLEALRYCRLKQVFLMRLMGRQNVKRELRVVTRYGLRSRAGSGTFVSDKMNILKLFVQSWTLLFQIWPQKPYFQNMYLKNVISLCHFFIGNKHISHEHPMFLTNQYSIQYNLEISLHSFCNTACDETWDKLSVIFILERRVFERNARNTHSNNKQIQVRESILLLISFI